MFRFLSSIGLLAALVAGVLALPVQVPYTVSGTGILLPAQEWMLVRDQDGSVGTILRDNIFSSLRSVDVFRFERGDAVRYRLDPAIGVRSSVAAGDTVLRIRSNETERMLAALSGQVAAAESAVSFYASGEKDAIVARAERNHARYVEEVEQAGREVDRLRRLNDGRVVAERDLEEAESRLHVLEAQAAMANAELTAATTGAKDEQLDLARSEADARRGEMAAVSERLDLMTIRTPISGVAVRSFGADTLLTVRDTTAAVLALPIPWKEAYHLHTDQTVRVRMRNVPVTMDGRLVGLDRTVRRLQGAQVVMATVLVDHPPPETLVGAVARGDIEAESVRLFEYARRKVLN